MEIALINQSFGNLSYKLSSLYQKQLPNLNKPQLKELAMLMVTNMIEVIISPSSIAYDLDEMVEIGQGKIYSRILGVIPQAQTLLRECGVKIDNLIYLRDGMHEISEYGYREITAEEWTASKLQRLNLHFFSRDNINLIEEKAEEIGEESTNTKRQLEPVVTRENLQKQVEDLQRQLTALQTLLAEQNTPNPQNTPTARYSQIANKSDDQSTNDQNQDKGSCLIM